MFELRVSGKQFRVSGFGFRVKETLKKLISLMVRQAHHERNQQLAVRPELVEGLVQRFLNTERPRERRF